MDIAEEVIVDGKRGHYEWNGEDKIFIPDNPYADTENQNLAHSGYDKRPKSPIQTTARNFSNETPLTPATAVREQFDPTQPYLGLIQKYRPKPDETDMETQRKIAKGNALAEAFRVMIDAAGGAKGANIIKREAPANAVLQAVDKYQKAKDANKAEQESWDKLELGQGIKALESESQQRFASQKQKESQDFTAEERKKAQEFQAGQTKGSQEFQAGQTKGEQVWRSTESQKARDDEKLKLKQQAEQFRQELGLKSRSQTEDTATKYAQIEASRERYRNMYPYGSKKGMFINDTDVQQQINIPDDKKTQVLAYIGADPNVQNEIPIIKMRYGNVGTDALTDYLIADLYSSLKPETRAQIRKFIGTQATPQAPGATQGSPFLFYKNPPPQTPTIKTNKNSTTVQVTPAGNTQEQPSTLSPDQVQTIQKGLNNPNYTPEQKRSGVYNYLIKQGYDAANAKELAESAYQSLIGK
jgi:hypothetical protein